MKKGLGNYLATKLRFASYARQADTPQYHLPELPWLNKKKKAFNGARQGRQRAPVQQDKNADIKGL